MNWNEKATLIASEIIEECGADSVLTLNDAIRLLHKAAMRGMEFECENWVRMNR